MERIWQCKEKGYIFPIKNIGKQDQGTVKSELDMLYVEGKAEKEVSSYCISHEEASLFDEEERELLMLPRIFPYRIEIKNKGMARDTEFHFIRYFLKPDGTPFINPKIIGSYIEIAPDIFFMFNHEQYQILRMIEESREGLDADESRQMILTENLRRVADIQKGASLIQAKLDEYLKTTQVVAPSKLSISVTKLEDGTYRIDPILLDSDGIQMNEEINQEFQKRFQAKHSVEALYRKSDGYFVFNKDQLDGLNQIKKQPRMAEEKVKGLLLNPRSVFTGDVFQFDSKYYSDRVESYGTFIKENLPYIISSVGSWLPEEGTSTYGIEKINEPNINQENAQALMQLIISASEKNKNTILYQGKEYPLTSAFIRKVGQVCNGNTAADDTVGKEPINGKVTKNKTTLQAEADERQSLIIKDNLDTLDYSNIIRKNKRAGLLEDVDIFSGLRETISLYEHQKAGIQWIFDNWKQGYSGVLLADDMGLGKTMQALAFAAGLKVGCGESGMGSVLIVAPVSLLQNWKEEFYKFIKPGLFEEIVEIYGTHINQYNTISRETFYLDFEKESRNKVVLTTYETLRTYDISFGRIDWSIMIIDEAQKIKNPNSLTARAIKAMKCDFGIALTGTPVENTWIDLWSIMDFVIPGKLGSLKEFNQKYQNRLKDIRNDLNAMREVGATLEKALQPVFLRRKKSDHLKGLPLKQINKLEEMMPPVQKALYEAVIREAQQKIGKGEIFRIIAALRDASLYPNLSVYSENALLRLSADSFFSASARLKATLDILKNIEKKKEKVLIFLESRKLQRILKYFLEQFFSIQILPPINGTVNSESRQAIVHAFQEKKGFAILLLSPEAGGVGFNIIGANHVIHLSRCWNPAKEDQATDRVYRIGQTKDVQVYLPIAIDPSLGKGSSFDEKLDQLLDFKRRLSESVLFPTGDTEEDGVSVLNDLLNSSDTEISEIYSADFWTVKELENVTTGTFRQILCEVYRNVPGYQVKILQRVNSNGADFLVYTDKSESRGFVVCCLAGNIEPDCFTKVMDMASQSALYYSKKCHGHFQGVVIANAKEFPQEAYDEAKKYNIRLSGRNELEAMLKKYPVSKIL